MENFRKNRRGISKIFQKSDTKSLNTWGGSKCLTTFDFDLAPNYYEGKLYRTPRLDYPKNVIHF